MKEESEVTYSANAITTAASSTYSVEWATLGSSLSARLRWAPSLDGFGATINRYSIYRYSTSGACPANDSAGIAIITTAGTKIKRLEVSSAEPLITYDDDASTNDSGASSPDASSNHCYLIRALGPNGEESTTSTVLSLASQGQLLLSPISPQRGSTNISLSWKFSSPVVRSTDQFHVHYSADEGASWTPIGSIPALDGPLTNQPFSINWNVPALNSSVVRVRVTYVNNTTSVTRISTSDPFVVDSAAPVLALNPIGALLRGGSSQTVTLTASDALSGVASLVLKYAADGLTFSEVASLSAAATSYSWTVPSHDTSVAKLQLIATDVAGNTATFTSNAFTIDSTTPVLSLSAIAGSPFANGSVLSLNWVLTEANVNAGQNFSIESSSDGGTTWSSVTTVAAQNGPLVNQAFSYGWTVPAWNTAQAKLRIKYTDLSGQSVAATSANFTIDSVAPAISSFTLAGGTATVALPDIAVQITATDNLTSVAHMRFSETETFADSDWLPFSEATTFSLSLINGDKTVYAWVKDAAGKVSARVSAPIKLSSVPPEVSITGPDGSTNFSTGQNVPITWNCSCGSGLAPSPILIEYTDDDGVTFPDIAANLANTGTYNWALPAALNAKPFRITISCKSAAGVVAKAYSQYINSPNWSIFMGDPWYGLKDVSATMANVGGTSFASVTADKRNNVFYTKGHAVLRIDGATGLVTEFAGQMDYSGCTMATGIAPTSKRFTWPKILGTNATGDVVLVLSKGCNKVFGIHTSNGSVTELATLTAGPGTITFLTRNRTLLYIDASTKIYKVDLNSAGNSPVHVHGDGTCTPNLLAQGADARSSPLRTGKADFSCAPTDILLMANADATKIWVNSYHLVNAYRLDASGDHYVIGQANTGWNSASFQNCTPTEFDSYVYCGPRYGGRNIKVFDPVAETWTGASTLPFTNNDDAGFLSLGSAPQKLLAHYSLNTISTVVPSTWTYNTIAGQPLSIMGNGGPPSGVGFDTPKNIRYTPGNNVLWVANHAGHVRKIDLSTSPYTTSTIFQSGFWSGLSVNYNPAGTRMTMNTGCTRMYLFNFDLTNNAAILPAFLGGPCNSTFGVYPAPSGTNANDGSALFTGANTPGEQIPLYHSNGKVYFGTKTLTDNVFVYESNGTIVNRVAGVVGPGGYVGAEDTGPASGAHLTHVRHLQELSDGDLLIWDLPRLRKITITTEAAEPKIYTLIDYSAIAGYPGAASWNDAYYDEVTGYTYYVYGTQVRKTKPGVGDTAYDFTGTSFSGYLRITKVPDIGLLVLQPNKARILRVAP